MSMRVETPPPPTEVADDGGGSDWVQLITAANDIDAHLLEGCLLQAGIEVRAIKDRSGPTWLLGGSDPWAPVAIWVRRFQYDDSRIVLAEVSYAAPNGAPEPSPAKGWSPVMWWTVAIALGLGFTGIALARGADYIERCGFSATCEEAP